MPLIHRQKPLKFKSLGHSYDRGIGQSQREVGVLSHEGTTPQQVIGE